MTKTNSVKFLSISALSAAGVAASGTQADAAFIYTNVNSDVGLGSGQATSLTLDLPGINDINVLAGGLPGGMGLFQSGAFLSPAGGATYVNVRRSYAPGTVGGFAQLLTVTGAGPVWSTMAGAISGAGGAFGSEDTTYNFIIGSNFTGQYTAFQFRDSTAGGAVRYGWIQADWTMVNSGNFNVHITGFGYDNTGAEVAMGSQGIAPVPAPPTVLAGLAALVIGAPGLRRWRKAKAAV